MDYLSGIQEFYLKQHNIYVLVYKLIENYKINAYRWFWTNNTTLKQAARPSIEIT